ncbi:MAG TPA: hypothetical protein VGG04_16350 [Candidatus Sulfotelmatobacter sp.]|jgi:hypothetical protein
MQEETQPADPSAIEKQPDPPDFSGLNEDQVLAHLENRDLSFRDIEELSRNSAIMKSRKVRRALAAHPHTPRRIALRTIREFYTFELMNFALTPAAAADLKRVADELLVARLASISLGERISLARRCSPLVAAALLLDKDKRVWEPALGNPRTTEAAIVKALQRTAAAPAFLQALCRHAKWSVRPEIRVALLRNAHTPLARAIEFARGIPPRQLRDILHASRLPGKTKEYLRKNLKSGDSKHD